MYALTARRTRLVLVLVLNVVHPFIHGTPLDGGALDGLIVWANSAAIQD